MQDEPRLFESQRRASAPAASVWVAASAGSGKTKVLVDRVLRLLLDGTAVERILCLTFTRAAAAEMANRIKEALGAWSSLDDAALARSIAALTDRSPEEPLLRTARGLFTHVLDAPGGLRIMTIHAFCESLLGRFPLEAGVAPHFQVMDERSAAEVMHDSRDELLVMTERGDADALARALAEVAGRVNEDEFNGLMTALAAERGRLREIPSEDDYAGVVSALCGYFGVNPDDTDSKIVAAACEDAAMDVAGLRAAAAALAAGSKTDRDRGALLERWLSSPADRPACFETYAAALLTSDSGSGWKVRGRLATNPVELAAPGTRECLETEARRLLRVDLHRRSLAVARASEAVLRIAGGLLQRYEAHKRRRAELDYDDLILLVRTLLDSEGSVPWVLYKLDGGIDHILIDEAQDTSPDQWAVVRSLSGEFFAGTGASDRARTVFAVGDAKQSIFSFQRAAPEEFEHMRDFFAARAKDAQMHWDDVALDMSFRSTEPVLRAVDAVFARPEAYDGLGDAAPAHRAYRAGQAGLVEVWPPVMPDPRDDEAPWEPPGRPRRQPPTPYRLAHALAERIDDWLTRGEVLESRARPVHPGDVMVLVRRRTQFVDDLVEALKTRSVPVAGVDRMVLGDHIAVMDLLALGRFVLLPEDDLTLAEVLKGPLLGFDEDDLFALAHGRGERSLWHELRRRAPTDDRLTDAAGYLSGLLASADYAPPFEFFSSVLGALRGRERFVARLGVQANDPLDEFLSLTLAYERSHAPSLQGFLHWFAEGGTEIKRDLEHAGDEVRVMTVHGAKGLQAPIVVLADTMQVPNQVPGLMWTEPTGGGGDRLMVWRPRAANREDRTKALEEAANLERDREYRRLLYVAMTRAEDRLYICGYGTRRTPPDGCWYNLIVRGLEGIAEESDITIRTGVCNGWSGRALRIDDDQAAPPDKAVEIAQLHRPIAPLPTWAREPALNEPAVLRSIAPSQLDMPEPAVSPPLTEAGEPGFRRGNLIHRLLQTLPQTKPADRRDAALRYLGQDVHGIDPQECSDIANEVLSILEAPAFAALFGPASRAEVPLSGEVGGVLVSGRVDRLVIEDKSIRIVDFKANRMAPATEDAIPVVYLRQLAAYRAVLRKIYPQFSISCGILWTSVPCLAEVSSALLDRHAP